MTKFKNKATIKIFIAVFATLIVVQRIYSCLVPTIEIVLPAYGSFSVSVFRDTYIAEIDGTEYEVNDLNYENKIFLGTYLYPNNTVKIRMISTYKKRKVVATCISVIGSDIDNPNVKRLKAAFEILPAKDYFYKRCIRLDDNFHVIEKYEKRYFFSDVKEADFYFVDRCNFLQG